jgi:hypothetical protein
MSLNVPAEYIQGFIKSGQQFWCAMAGLDANDDPQGDTHTTAEPPEALAQLSLFALRRDGFSPISDTAAAVTR